MREANSNTLFAGFKKTFWLFFPHIIHNRNSRYRCGITLILLIIDILANSLVPYFSKQVVNTLSLDIKSSFGLSVALLGFFWTLEKIMTHLQEIIFFPVINCAIRDITHDVVNHIHEIPLSHYQTLSIPEIISCIKRISASARSFIKVSFLLIIPTVLKLFITAIVVLKIGLLGATLIPTCLISAFLLYKGIQHYGILRAKTWELTDIVTMRINDSIANTKITRHFHGYEMNAVSHLLNTEANLWVKTNTQLHLIHILIIFMLGSTITFILYRTFHDIQRHLLSIGDFVLIKSQLIAAFLPFKNLSIELRQLAESIVDIKKIILLLEIQKQRSETAIPPPLHYPSSKTEALTLDRVSFGYPEKSLLNEVSLHIPVGEKIAILGDNGCGKSSLMTILAALQKPHHGTVRIHGQPIEHYDPTLLNKLIHFIPQDFRLFNLTLRDNLTYGLDSISDSEIFSVLEKMDLHGLVQHMTNGLNTLMGDMGARLSGGEKQRVAISRALLLKPSILLLDETLQSLNTNCEEKILNNIFGVIPTIVLVSHRASTLQFMDRAYQLKNKKLVEVPILSRVSTRITAVHHPGIGIPETET